MMGNSIDAIKHKGKALYVKAQVTLVYLVCLFALFTLILGLYTLCLALEASFIPRLREFIVAYLNTWEIRAVVFFIILLITLFVRFLKGPKDSLLKFEEKIIGFCPLFAYVITPVCLILANNMFSNDVFWMISMTVWLVLASVLLIPIILLLCHKQVTAKTVLGVFAFFVTAFILISLSFVLFSKDVLFSLLAFVYIAILAIPLMYVKLALDFQKEQGVELLYKIKSIKQTMAIICALFTLYIPFLFIIGLKAAVVSIGTIAYRGSLVSQAIACTLPLIIFYIFMAVFYKKTIKPVAEQKGYEL